MNDPLHLGNSLWHLTSMRMQIIYQVGRLTLKLKNWEFILLKLAASQDDFYFSIFKLFVSCRSISKGAFAYDVSKIFRPAPPSVWVCPNFQNHPLPRTSGFPAVGKYASCVSGLVSCSGNRLLVQNTGI